MYTFIRYFRQGSHQISACESKSRVCSIHAASKLHMHVACVVSAIILEIQCIYSIFGRELTIHTVIYTRTRSYRHVNTVVANQGR